MGFQFGHDLGLNAHWRGIDPLHDILRQYFDQDCEEAVTQVPVNCITLQKILIVIYQLSKQSINQ